MQRNPSGRAGPGARAHKHFFVPGYKGEATALETRLDLYYTNIHLTTTHTGGSGLLRGSAESIQATTKMP